MTKLAYNQDVLINGKRCYAFSIDGFAAKSFDQYGSENGEDRDTYIANKVANEINKWGMSQSYQFLRHSSVLTNDRAYYEREQERWANVAQLNVGDVVEFEGKTWTITKAPNDNFGLELTV